VSIATQDIGAGIGAQLSNGMQQKAPEAFSVSRTKDRLLRTRTSALNDAPRAILLRRRDGAPSRFFILELYLPQAIEDAENRSSPIEHDPILRSGEVQPAPKAQPVAAGSLRNAGGTDRLLLSARNQGSST
jgi:hypothetical protein